VVGVWGFKPQLGQGAEPLAFFSFLLEHHSLSVQSSAADYSPPTLLFPRWLRILLLTLTAIRLGVAARAPLSADEAYYWIWSKALAPGYLDHPPMVALWIRAGTLIAGDTALGVRLLGPVSALLGSLLLLSAAEDFAPGRRAGPCAVCLLNATLALNVGAVVMTPDTPLLFFWTAALAACGRLIRTGRPAWWLAVGLCAGFALDSKYTAILLGGALALWLLVVPAARRWLRAWQLWAAAGLAALCFAPVIQWNAAHGFISFIKQGSRSSDWHPVEALRFISELFVGQIGLATPWVAVLLVLGMVFAARGLWRGNERLGLLACVTLLPAGVFCEHALGGRVQANWPAVIFPGAALAACAMPTARFWRPASVFGLLIAAVVFLQAAAAPITLPRFLDFTLIRLAGWSDLAGGVFVAQTRGKFAFVAADEYGLAAELAFRLHTTVLGVEPRWRFFQAMPVESLAGRTGLLVRSDREYGGPDPHLWSSITSLGSLERKRAGVVAETYRLFSVTGAKGAAGAVLPQGKQAMSKLAPD
jgi:4-amino-4-deoxy-L-arabinose transferase-like glycosyltransferase